MYTFKGKTIDNPICIHFLCGNKYKKDRDDDKRNIVMKYINSFKNNYALILERYFKITDYLDLGFDDLEKVELMTSHYAKSIIIIHETNSTAGEIALFGSKSELKDKMLVIYPPPSLIEVDNVGAFLREAFFKNDKIVNKHYLFEAKLDEESYPHVRFYDTYFIGNNLPEDFKKMIRDFWDYAKINECKLSFKKRSYNGSAFDTYSINNNVKSVKIILSYDLIMSLIFSLFSNKILRNQFRKFPSVDVICNLIKNILKNTIIHKEGINVVDYSIKIKMIDEQHIYIPVRYWINIMKAIGLINVKKGRYVFSHLIDYAFEEYKNIIINTSDKSFFADYSGE